MALIKGIDVVLHDKSEAGVDAFNHATYIETAVTVPNVLVTPASSEAIVNELQLSGKKLVYELCIPKSDTHTWEDRIIEFFGEKFHSFGLPETYIAANVPLGWNRKIKVERYE